MRRWAHISIVLLFAISLGITWQAITIVHFYSNQDQIENDYCVNKNKPELECHGKCHLSKVLSHQLDDYTDLNLKLNSSLIVFQAFQNVTQFTFNLANAEQNLYALQKVDLNGGFVQSLLNPPEIIS